MPQELLKVGVIGAEEVGSPKEVEGPQMALLAGLAAPAAAP